MYRFLSRVFLFGEADARQHSFWGMSGLFLCHPHLTRIIASTAVWAQACGLKHKKHFCHIGHLWVVCFCTVFLVVLGCRREQYLDSAIIGTDYSGPRNRERLWGCACVGELTKVSRYCYFCVRLGDGRSDSHCGQERWWNASGGSGALDTHSLGRSSRTDIGGDQNQGICVQMAERSSSSENSITDSKSCGRGHGVGLKIMKNETTEAFTGRSRIVFAHLQTEGANLPSEARGDIVLRGCRLGRLGRATIMSATRRSWEFDEVCTAIRTSFPACPPDGWSHGSRGVDELDEGVEDHPQDHGGDTELESRD